MNFTNSADVKNPSLHLFNLIKTLTKNEKGFIKKLYQQAGKLPDYIELMDALDSEKVYDEKLFVKKHARKSWTKYFANNKKVLYQNILRALSYYHSNDLLEDNQILSFIEVLVYKGLRKDALQIITKAKHNSLIQEKNLLYQQLCEWEFECLTLLRDEKMLQKNLEKSFEITVENAYQTYVLTKLKYATRVLTQPRMQSIFTLEDNGLQQIIRTYEKYIVDVDETRLSERCKKVFLNAILQYQYLNLQFPDSLQTFRRMLQLVDKHNTSPTEYYLLNLWIVFYLLINEDYDEARQVLQKNEQLIAHLPNNLLTIRENLMVHQLTFKIQLLIHTQKASEAIAYYTKHSHWQKAIEKKISKNYARNINFYYSLALYYSGQVQEAYNNLNTHKEDSAQPYFDNVELFKNFFIMFLYADLSKISLLKVKLQSVKRLLKKTSSRVKAPGIILNTLWQFAAYNLSETQRIKEIQKMMHSLQNLEHNKAEIFFLRSVGYYAFQQSILSKNVHLQIEMKKA